MLTPPITFDNFDAGWCGGAATTQVQISGNNTLKKNTGVVCHGIEFQSNRLDLSAFTHIHFDFYITDTDLTGDVFNVKLVDFGGGSAEASALEININGGSTPQLVANQWVSVDVPITALGGVVANNLGSDFHVYSMNWSPNQITFLLDGVAFYTYNPTVKNASTWPFNAEQYLLLNIAMGGVAGVIPSNFTQATMEIDYVRVFQNVAVDNQAPTNFTAAVGNITSSSIELLLNASDNFGTVNYDINYGSNSINTFGTSGVQKSVIVPNLTPNTNYTFSIAASDPTGNNAANNAIVLNATTLGFVGCSGTSNEASQGTFSTAYTYSFETLGTNSVKVTFELLDTDKIGVVAYLWRQSPFAETPMSNVSGNTFTYTLTGQTNGATINYAVKFAYANGMSVTRYFSYVVGNNCSLHQDTNAFTEFTFTNPSHDFISIASDITIDKVEIFNLIGNKVITQTLNTNQIDVSSLSKGMYLMVVYANNRKGIKKMIIH